MARMTLPNSFNVSRSRLWSLKVISNPESPDDSTLHLGHGQNAPCLISPQLKQRAIVIYAWCGEGKMRWIGSTANLWRSGTRLDAAQVHTARWRGNLEGLIDWGNWFAFK